MEKIKKLFEKELEDFRISYNKEKMKIFLVTIITSLIVHFQLYALMITGPDTLINSVYHLPNVWEPRLLRFGLLFVQVIKGNIVSPVLATLISSVFLGITVNLVIDIFEIKNKILKYIIAIVFVVAPNVSATLTFFYCSDAYILGMLLATLSVYLVRKHEDKKIMMLIGGFLIAIAMGMYQTYLSITMVLAVATLIIDIISKKETKQILVNILKYVIMGVLGIVLFYIISHVVLLISNLPISSYSGANTIGLNTLIKLPTLLPEAYQSFFSYYFNDNMIPNTIWNTNILYVVIFAVALISTVYIIIINKIYKKISNILLVMVLVFIEPICFGIIEIIVPDVDIHILMACSMIYVFPIFFKILEMLPKSILSNCLKWVTIICSLGVVWIYIWQDNASYIAINAMQNQAVSTSERILTQIEQLDEYTKDMPVLILGGIKESKYLDRNDTSMETKKIYDKSWGFISEKSTIWWGNLDSWRKLFYEYLGVNINLVSEWESAEIFETEEYKSMKYYPEKDSIKVINGTVVVKLSD